MSLQQERVLAGLCPVCGKEAAPYYLCHSCRFRGQVRYVLRRGEKLGGFSSERKGRDKWWRIADKKALDNIKWRADPKEGDRRIGPRLQGIRVDVEATLIEVIKHIGRPCTEDEIIRAWGRLRSRRTSPLSVDLARIIAAEDRRKRRAAKRLGL